MSHFLALIVIAALAVGIAAAPASAKMSAKQKAQIRAKLKKQVKKNPGVINKKRFVKKAALVNFKLPITVRLRTGDIPATPANEAAANNTNAANLDLGPSLGQRQVNLGGALAGEITFRDSFDGGALGNVDLALNSGPKKLTSTSIPLLWNTQVSNPITKYESNFLGLPDALDGCGNWVTSNNIPFGAGFIDSPFAAPGNLAGLPGFPHHAAADPGGNPEGFLPIDPGVDDINALVAAKDPGNPLSLGGNPDPFPQSAQSDPLASNIAPSVKDTVLRTAPLELAIAQPGTEVNQATNADGVFNSQNIVIGKSGGQANLFGNIPGKSYGIDVTVSLATKIASIFRIVDQDVYGTNVVEGDDWPAGIFNCRQVYSGSVDNYIPGVRLKGSLKISPGITSDGKLRIAKATLQSQEGTRFAVAACLVPHSAFQVEQNGSNAYPQIPDPNPADIPAPVAPPALQPTANLPVDVDNYRPAPTAPCNSQPTGLVAYSALTPAEVTALAPAVPANGYTVNNSGSVAAVSADLNVTNVSADILIGDE